MQMTKQQFDSAVESLQQGVCDSELDARVFTAACFVIKQREGVPDDVEWHAPPEPELMSMVREFLTGLSAIQRKRLKRIAESLEKTTLH